MGSLHRQNASPEEKVLADKFTADRKKFVAEGLKPTLAALHANKIETAKQLVAEKIRPLYKPSGRDRGLNTYEVEAARQEYELALSRSVNIRNFAIVAVAFGLGLVAWLGFVLIRAITRPLDAAVKACACGCRRRPDAARRNPFDG